MKRFDLDAWDYLGIAVALFFFLVIWPRGIDMARDASAAAALERARAELLGHR